MGQEALAPHRTLQSGGGHRPSARKDGLPEEEDADEGLCPDHLLLPGAEEQQLSLRDEHLRPPGPEREGEPTAADIPIERRLQIRVDDFNSHTCDMISNRLRRRVLPQLEDFDRPIEKRSRVERQRVEKVRAERRLAASAAAAIEDYPDAGGYREEPDAATSLAMSLIPQPAEEENSSTVSWPLHPLEDKNSLRASTSYLRVRSGRRSRWTSWT